MRSTSSAALADSVSALSAPECEQSRSANQTCSAAQSSASTGPTSPASMTFAPLTQVDWVGSDESILSAEASPASRSATQDGSEPRLTTVTSGRRCARLLHSRDRLGSLARTLLGSSRWHSTMCWLTWKVSATPRGRLLFRLLPSMRYTDGIASGSLLATPTWKANQLSPSMMKWPGCAALLPTPTAQNYGTNQGGAAGRVGPVRPSLETMARHGLWPSPRTKGLDGGANSRKAAKARGMWPTPRAMDGAKGAAKELARTSGPDLPAVAGGSLNPTWVEWLMGFPEGWTALELSEMPSSRKSSKKSAAQS
jgi:hypothetical protein